MPASPKIMTCLWFDKEAEQAAEFYMSLIPGSRITHISRYGKGARMPEGLAMVVTFALGDATFMGLNGGPVFQQSEAASIVVLCEDQAEIDRLWSALTANGGRESQCGWVKDRFGVSWQIVPRRVSELMTDADPAKRGRVMAAVMQMVKFDIAKLEEAARGD